MHDVRQRRSSHERCAERRRDEPAIGFDRFAVQDARRNRVLHLLQEVKQMQRAVDQQTLAVNQTGHAFQAKRSPRRSGSHRGGNDIRVMIGVAWRGVSRQLKHLEALAEQVTKGSRAAV